MLIRNWRYGALVAVAVLALAASNGCCCRTKKGIVLRGDWSLEFNRVPHMQSNGPTYSGDCSAPVSCGVPCGCADGSCHGGHPSGGYEVLDGSGYPGGGGSGGGGHGSGAGGHGAEGGVPMPPPPQPAPAAQSRFQPVPTRPAFEPQGLAWEGEPAMEAAVAAPRGPAPSARRGAQRVVTSRQLPVRRASAEFESEIPAEIGDSPTADEGQLTTVSRPMSPAAPTLEPVPTTSTWRVKSRQL